MQLGHSSVGDLGIEEGQEFKIVQPFQVHQPRVEDQSAAEVEVLQALQPLQMDKAVVSDIGADERQEFKLGQCEWQL